MSTEGYDKYADELQDHGTLIYEKDLVHPTIKEGQPTFGVPSPRIADTLGRAIVQNIVMMGFFTAVTQVVTREQMRTAVKASVPPGTEELNLKAFDAGCAYFDQEYGQAAASTSNLEEVRS